MSIDAPGGALRATERPGMLRLFMKNRPHGKDGGNGIFVACAPLSTLSSPLPPLSPQQLVLLTFRGFLLLTSPRLLGNNKRFSGVFFCAWYDLFCVFLLFGRLPYRTIPYLTLKAPWSQKYETYTNAAI